MGNGSKGAVFRMLVSCANVTNTRSHFVEPVFTLCFIVQCADDNYMNLRVLAVLSTHHWLKVGLFLQWFGWDWSSIVLLWCFWYTFLIYLYIRVRPLHSFSTVKCVPSEGKGVICNVLVLYIPLLCIALFRCQSS